jgi:hypothetical protein
MSKVCVLFTGAYRTFDKTYKHILDNILKPNSAKAFILCETEQSQMEFENLIRTRWDEYVGSVKGLQTTRTSEFNNIIEYLFKSKPGLSNTKLNEHGFNQDYLKNSGSILEYYQFMKCYELMLEYERINNVKFDIIIRSRLDLIITQPLNLLDFFNKIDNNLLAKYKEDVYIRSLGNENMAKELSDNKVVKLFEYEPFRKSNTIFDISATLKKINENKQIWTFYCNWIWIAKRHTMDLLYSFIYFYGHFLSNKRDYFNSENQFFDYLNYHNCEIHHFFTQNEWDLWTQHEVHGYKTILDDTSLNPEIDISKIIATIIRH